MIPGGNAIYSSSALALTPGSRLGVYEIIAPLGEGGMGVVYRARDTKLGREVAIKVLPDPFVSDPERLARFEREARTLASISHPHIAHVYGVEESGTTHALVMELVDGLDLSQRIAQGPVPLDEALSIAKQIAEALEAAHDQGIVHRDLKPANIKVSHAGVVKVLDFGLAKTAEASSPHGSAAIANSPTFTSPAMTMHGVILGTAAYMAPEQAKGKVVDRRADIWSFGVVLFEMLTGRRAFDGEDISDVLVAVLSKDVDLSLLPAGTPRAISQLLKRCLDRDPRRRLRDVGEARLAIEDVLSPGGAEAPVDAPMPADATRRPWLLFVACTIAVAVAAGVLGYRANGVVGEVRTPQHLAIHLAPNQEIAIGSDGTMGFSPDGSTLVFPAIEDGRTMLLQRRLDSNAAVAIAGSEGANSPGYSPDGKWISFANGVRLMKIAPDGGRPIPIAGATGNGSVVWLADGSLVYAPMYSEGLFHVREDGSGLERLTTPNSSAGELGHFFPEALPGDRYILFTAFHSPVDQSRIGVLDLQTKEVRWIVEHGFYAKYVKTGHILYAKDRRLYAQPFDAASATVTGAPLSVVDDIYVSQTNGYAPFAVSSQGTLAYVSESLGQPQHELVWIDRNGRPTPSGAEPRQYFSVSLSPDDSQAALSIRGDNLDLWTFDFGRRLLSRVTNTPATEYQPTWSPDGRELLFVYDRPPFELHRIGVTAPSVSRPLWKEPPQFDTTTVSAAPDGRTVAFVRNEPETGGNVYTRSIDGGTAEHVVSATPAAESYPSFSPDGSSVAYASNQSGRSEIYVQTSQGSGERFQISVDGGTEPFWSKNGEIFFRHDNELWVASARTAGTPAFGTARKLFTFRMSAYQSTYLRVYAVSSDGQRILAISTPDATRPRQIEVVTDWLQTLAGRTQ